MNKKGLKNFQNKSPEMSIDKTKSTIVKEDFSPDLKIIKWLTFSSRLLFISSIFIVIYVIFELLSGNNFGSGEALKYYTFILMQDEL